MSEVKNSQSSQNKAKKATNSSRQGQASANRPRRNFSKNGQVKKQNPNNNQSGAQKQTPNQNNSKSQGQSKNQAQNQNKNRSQNKPQSQKTGNARNTQRTPKTLPVRIIPLGGLNEIGKNITVYEYGDEGIVVDCGLAFPENEQLGVDLVIPDFTYVIKNQHNIKGIFITHGHEDHIGSLPYLLKQVNLPVYATRLTAGLIENKLKEHGLDKSVKINVIGAGEVVKAGKNFTVEFINVNHSIPDAVAFAITTPAGVIVQTGDFKVDYTPVQGDIIDLARFGELGQKGVLALLSDSTNSERPGSSVSESKVGESFERLFAQAGDRRVIIATFSSNIHRVQQIIDMAVKTGRKVAVSGRSMVNVTETALRLGYLKAPKDVIIPAEQMSRYPNKKVVLVTTGSQGEPMSALSRMSSKMHRQVELSEDDFIIISATPIPGNEKHVNRVVNDLMKQGTEVIYEKMYDVHVSGHAYQDEQRLMLGLVKPKYFLPVHGEFKHLRKHAQLAGSLGIPEKNIIIGDNGLVIELSEQKADMTEMVPAGKVFVDGLGVGDVGSVVIRDRKHLSEDGIIIVMIAMDRSGKVKGGPDVISRGFVYVKESEELLSDAKEAAAKVLKACTSSNIREWGIIKQKVRDDLSAMMYRRTKRSPMILPIIMEV